MTFTIKMEGYDKIISHISQSIQNKAVMVRDCCHASGLESKGPLTS